MPPAPPPPTVAGEMATTTEGGRRPRVLILGGGFAGIGAARKLKRRRRRRRARRPARLPHLPAAPLPGRDRPARDGRRSAIRSATSSTSSRTSRVHQATVTAIDLDAARGAVRGDGAARLRLPRARRSARRSTSSAREGAAEHAFPMYTLADAVRLKEHVLERWEAADRDPSLVDDGALNVVVVGGGPTGVESVGALAELYRTQLREGLPRRLPQDAGAARTSSRRGRRSSRCSSRTSAPTRRRCSRSAASR